MNSAAAGRLALRLSEKKDLISKRVTTRLLATFPELIQLLKLEGGVSPEERLTQVSTGRLVELVRAILIFETLSLADQEFQWAGGVLPRTGVTYRHQSFMVRWFFEELGRLGLDAEELMVARELEHYILDVVAAVYKV